MKKDVDLRVLGLFGSMLAVVMSFHRWESALWAIIHGALSWAYVAYYLVTR